MKRMMIIAAAFAVLVSCSKSEPVQNPSTETPSEETPSVVSGSFTAGQTVTITAVTPQTKVSSSLNSDGKKVDFKWGNGDTIKVTVGETSSVFKVSKLENEGASAEFTGTMPASGDEFSVQYPVNEPVLSSQTYSSSGEAMPHDAMKFTAEGCKVGKPFTLTAQYAALRLNLWGENQTIGKIVVTNTTSTADPKPSYTLNINPAVKIGSTSDDSTSFFIVVDPGSWDFKAEIFDTDDASICSFTTSSPKTFEANQILNMSAKKVESVLLPGKFTVNSSGKQVQFTKGNLYWDGSAFHLESTQTAYPTSWSTDYVGHFFWTNLTDYQSGTASYMPYASSYSHSARSTSDKFWCGEDNKLTVDGTEGLYVLTKDEWSYLIDSRVSGLYKYGVTVSSGGTNYTNCFIIAPDDYSGTALSSITDWSLSNINSLGLVCLPAAGYRGGSGLLNGGSLGYYWSATPGGYNEYDAYISYFDGSSVTTAKVDNRYYGNSVRLVHSVSSK